MILINPHFFKSRRVRIWVLPIPSLGKEVADVKDPGSHDSRPMSLNTANSSIAATPITAKYQRKSRLMDQEVLNCRWKQDFNTNIH